MELFYLHASIVMQMGSASEQSPVFPSLEINHELDFYCTAFYLLKASRWIEKQAFTLTKSPSANWRYFKIA